MAFEIPSQKTQAIHYGKLALTGKKAWAIFLFGWLALQDMLLAFWVI